MKLTENYKSFNFNVKTYLQSLWFLNQPTNYMKTKIKVYNLMIANLNKPTCCFYFWGLKLIFFNFYH